MIPAGLLDGLRLRARCYALRVRTVDELEQQRDDARGRARALEIERDQARAEVKRAGLARLDAEFDAVRWHVEVGALLGRNWRSDPKLTDDQLLARLRQVLADGTAAHRAADDAAEVCGSHELARADAEDRLSHWRREVAALTALPVEGTSDEELLTKLQRRVNGVPGTPGAILGAWQQVCRLVDPDGDLPLSPASIVDRVAALIEQRDHARQAADAWRPPREAYDPAMGGDIEPPPGRPDQTEVPF